MKTHAPTDKFFNDLVDNGYKAISMFDLNGDRLIQYNNSKVPLKEKIKEVKQRLNTLPNGIYILKLQFNYSQRTKPDTMYINKGNVDESVLNEAPPTPPQTIRERQTTKDEKKMDSVVSLDSALSRIEELSQLRAENAILIEKVKNLEQQISELETEISELENEAPGMAESKDIFGNWIEKITPTLAPLADEYFKLQNRKLRLEEFKIMNAAPQRKRQQQKQKTLQYPDINNEEQLNKFFNWLEKLNDDDFSTIINDCKQNYPELYVLIEQEFFEDENEQEQEKQQQ